MEKVYKIKKKKNADYIINEIGEIIEIETKTKVIGKIEKKAGKEYTIEKNGDVMEREVFVVKFKDYYKLKDRGDITKAVKEGKIIKIDYEDLPISALQNIDNLNIKSQIEGRCIENVDIETKKDGSRLLRMKLDNGKSIILKEGLLVQGSVIEIE